MGFTEAVASVLGKYAVFSGRAPRSEYWWWYLFEIVVSLVVFLLVDAISAEAVDGVSLVITLALIIPTLAVTVRRLHDTNRTGWWLFINLIPVVGWVVFLVFLILPGTPGPNRYGAPYAG